MELLPPVVIVCWKREFTMPDTRHKVLSLLLITRVKGPLNEVVYFQSALLALIGWLIRPWFGQHTVRCTCVQQQKAMGPKRSASAAKKAAPASRSRSSSRTPAKAASPAKAEKVYGGITHSGAEDYEFGGPWGCLALMLWSHYILFYFWFVLFFYAPPSTLSPLLSTLHSLTILQTHTHIIPPPNHLQVLLV